MLSIYRNYILIVIIFFFLSFFFLAHSSLALDGDLQFATSSNPTGSDDVANDVAVASSSIYVVGYQSSNVGRIEKRDLNLQLLWATSTTSFADIQGVAVDNSGVYLVGATTRGVAPPNNFNWYIDKRNHNGDRQWATSSAYSSEGASALDVVVIGSSVYIVGYYIVNYSGSSLGTWRIEKRDINSGQLQQFVTSTFMSYYDRPFSLTFDNNSLYIAGTAYDGAYRRGCIEKRSLGNIGVLEWRIMSAEGQPGSKSDVPVFFGIATSSLSTSTYLAGNHVDGNRWVLQKRRNDNGDREWLVSSTVNGVGSSLSPNPADLAINNFGIYIIGASSSGSNYNWRIEKRDFNGNFLWARETPYTGPAFSYAIALSSSSAYIVGPDFIPGNYEWRIEKREIGDFTLEIDCGLRARASTTIIRFACEKSGTLTSPLRFRKTSTTTLGVILVPTSSPYASPFRVRVSSTIRALKRY
jgi:hypothetical protein